MSTLLLMHYGLEFFARRSPHKTALIFRDRALDFIELNARANQVAHALAGAGIRKGDRAGAYLDNCLEYPEIIYGCSKAGVVLVPINYRLTASEASALLAHAQVRITFISQRLNAAFAGDERDHLARFMDQGLVTVGAGRGDGQQSYESWIEGHPTHDPGIDIDELDPFYIGYTSGTTGKSKGALISHRARALIILAQCTEYGLTCDDINLTPGAIYHAAPLIMMLMAINIGGTSVVMEHFDAEAMLRLTEEHGATNAFVAPTMLHMIHHLPEAARQRYRLDSMRVLVSAGAPLSAHDKEATRALFGDNVLHEYYGSTEAGWNLNLRPRDQLARPHSCGKPVLGWEIMLIDEQGEPVTAPNTVGEIYVRGEYMFDGYIDNPQATANAFRGDWFSAGDLASFDADGFYTIVGRKKDMIISGGANVYPEEVEDCLHTCPGVADVAVIGLPDDKWGERVAAMVVLTPDTAIGADEIKMFCEGRIAGFKKPREVISVDEIPRNPSGKIQKNILRERFARELG